jgi:hypothetical protein
MKFTDKFFFITFQNFKIYLIPFINPLQWAMENKSFLAISLIAVLLISVVSFDDAFAKDGTPKKEKTFESECAKELDKKKLNIHGLFCQAIITLQGLVADLDARITALEESSGSAIPISLGTHSQIIRNVNPCRDSSDVRTEASQGLVLLSDGTVRVPNAAGGFTSHGAEYGSLPAGVWHDIEGSWNFSERPDGCFTGFPASSFEFLDACAVNGAGDMYCAKGGSRDGVLITGSNPWTFQGNALP